MDETSINQRVADQICRNFRWKDRKFTVGECVALLDGEILVVADDFDQALNALRAREPDPKRGMLFQVRPPVMDVVRKVKNGDCVF